MSSDEYANILINRYHFSFSTVSAAFNALFGTQHSFGQGEVLAVVRLLSHTDRKEVDYTQWQQLLFDQSGWDMY